MMNGVRLALFLLTSLYLPATPWREYHINGHAQGTTYHIQYYARDSLFTQAAADSLLSALDGSFSNYNTASLLSRFNASPTGMEIDRHLEKLVKRSLDIWRDTKGESDITVAPLVQAWGFGPRPAGGLPDSAAIKAILPCVGAAHLHLRGHRLIKDTPCVTIDVNGIAQGYSVDVIAGFLERKGIVNYLVELGGEIRVKGHKQPGGTCFTIGIEAPDADNPAGPAIQQSLQAAEGGITTSGNYRRYYTSGGRTISHLIEPHTGYPIQNNLVSVTVWAPDAMTADGYDNALMAMGLPVALQFVQQHPGMEAFFIYRKANGQLADTATAGFRQMIRH